MSLRKARRLPRTLAFRLTLWYAGIFAGSSCVAFLLFYLLVSAVIRDRTDQELLGQVSRFSAVLSSAGAEEVANAAIIEAQAAGVRKVFFRLLYPTGEVFSSSNMSYWQDIGVRRGAVGQLLRERGPVIETVVVPGRKEKVRVLYALLSPSIILQVGQAMENDSRFLDAFKEIFILTMAFLILLASGVGWFMARRAMSGVAAVTRTARKIAEGTLDERVPVKSRGDEVDQLASTFNQMLDRIRALLTEMKEMSDNIAHDLRSPVARIRGAAEVTLTEGKNLTDFEAMAASTIEECDRLLDMINTMLVISKTESGADELSLVEIDAAGLVRSACELFSASAEDRGVALRCDAAEPLVLLGDLRLIQRMFSNLLDNAIKYTLAGGTVEISASGSDEGRVVLTVRDTGVGISPEELPRVFERFYRSDRSRSQPGIGLGLSLARAIARAHGGDIAVTSVPEQGSTFTVILPKKAGRGAGSPV